MRRDVHPFFRMGGGGGGGGARNISTFSRANLQHNIFARKTRCKIENCACLVVLVYQIELFCSDLQCFFNLFLHYRLWWIVKLSKLLGGGNDMFSPTPCFHWGATAPPPPSKIDASGSADQTSLNLVWYDSCRGAIWQAQRENIIVSFIFLNIKIVNISTKYYSSFFKSFLSSLLVFLQLSFFFLVCLVLFGCLQTIRPFSNYLSFYKSFICLQTIRLFFTDHSSAAKFICLLLYCEIHPSIAMQQLLLIFMRWRSWLWSWSNIEF